MARKHVLEEQSRSYLTYDQLAGLLSCSRRSLERRVVTDPSFPRPVKIGPRMVRFLASEVNSFLDGLAAAR
jgi:predicted DNA-binding transcriptional regulator AlpA